MSPEYTLNHLCHLIHSKNEVNKRRRKWRNRAYKLAEREHEYAMEKYEIAKHIGKKRMPRIKKIYKKIGAKLQWDNSGYVRTIICDGRVYCRNEIAIIAEQYRANKALEQSIIEA